MELIIAELRVIYTLIGDLKVHELEEEEWEVFLPLYKQIKEILK